MQETRVNTVQSKKPEWQVEEKKGTQRQLPPSTDPLILQQIIANVDIALNLYLVLQEEVISDWCTCNENKSYIADDSEQCYLGRAFC